MSRIYVEYTTLSLLSTGLYNTVKEINKCSNQIERILNQLDSSYSPAAETKKNSRSILNHLNQSLDSLKSGQFLCRDAAQIYEKLDYWDRSLFYDLKNDLREKTGAIVTGYLSSSKLYKFGDASIKAISKGLNGDKVGCINYLYKSGRLFSELYKTTKNYIKVSPIFGKQKTTARWAKNILGLSPLEYASQAATYKGRFINNVFKNEKSPFKISFDDYSGKNGVEKASAKWMEVAFSAGLNYVGNLNEQRESNGAMSDERVIAETVIETVADVVVQEVVVKAVGGAILSCFSVSPPGIVVLGTVTAVSIIGNSVFTHYAHKPFSEWCADVVLDQFNIQ